MTDEAPALTADLMAEFANGERPAPTIRPITEDEARAMLPYAYMALPSQERRRLEELRRLNRTLAYRFWREGWHGGFW